METLFRARRRTPEVEPVSDIWDDGLVTAAPLPQEELLPAPTMNGKQVAFFKQVLDMPAPEEGPAPGTYFANKAKGRSTKSKKEEMPTPAPAAKPVASDNVYVQYLPPDCGDEELFNLFSQIGEVKSCRVIMDFEKNRSKGYGFVLFARPEDAQRSVESYNGLAYNGKRLMVRLADHSPSTSNQSAAATPAADVAEVPTKATSNKQHWRETELKQHFGVYGLQSIRSARILVDDATPAVTPVANVPTPAVPAPQKEQKPLTAFSESDRQSQAQILSASTLGFRQRDSNRTGIESTAHAFGPSCWCGGSRCVEHLGLQLPRQDSAPVAETPSSYPSAQELYEQFQVVPGSRNVRVPGLAPCAPGAVLCRPPTHLINTAAAAGIQFYRHDPYLMGNSYGPAMDRSASSHQRRTWAPTV
jgi:hypothetical protein